MLAALGRPEGLVQLEVARLKAARSDRGLAAGGRSEGQAGPVGTGETAGASEAGRAPGPDAAGAAAGTGEVGAAAAGAAGAGRERERLRPTTGGCPLSRNRCPGHARWRWPSSPRTSLRRRLRRAGGPSCRRCGPGTDTPPARAGRPGWGGSAGAVRPRNRPAGLPQRAAAGWPAPVRGQRLNCPPRPGRRNRPERAVPRTPMITAIRQNPRPGRAVYGGATAKMTTPGGQSRSAGPAPRRPGRPAAGGSDPWGRRGQDTQPGGPAGQEQAAAGAAAGGSGPRRRSGEDGEPGTAGRGGGSAAGAAAAGAAAAGAAAAAGLWRRYGEDEEPGQDEVSVDEPGGPAEHGGPTGHDGQVPHGGPDDYEDPRGEWADDGPEHGAADAAGDGDEPGLIPGLAAGFRPDPVPGPGEHEEPETGPGDARRAGRLPWPGQAPRADRPAGADTGNRGSQDPRTGPPRRSEPGAARPGPARPGPAPSRAGAARDRSAP